MKTNLVIGKKYMRVKHCFEGKEVIPRKAVMTLKGIYPNYCLFRYDKYGYNECFLHTDLEQMEEKGDFYATF